MRIAALFLACLPLIFFGCAQSTLCGKSGSIKQELPSAYAKSDAPLLPKERQEQLFSEFKKSYFAPLESNVSFPTKSYEWGRQFALSHIGYKENLLLWSSDEKKLLLDSSKIADNSTVKAYAVTVSNCAVRALPTEKPFFLSPKTVGEGYPFDYFQLSSLHPAMPLAVFGHDPSGEWAYAVSSLAHGWINTGCIARLTGAQAKWLKAQPIAVAVKDGITLKKEGRFLQKAAVGAIFAAYEQNGRMMLFVPANETNGSATFLTVEANEFRVLPQKFSEKSVAALADETLKKPYGWGGYLGNRDCSMLTRDIFAPFGIFLPRNSYDQAGKDSAGYDDLSALSLQQKQDAIAQKAKPWQTLLYKKGHVMLYIGVQDGEPLIYHAPWGVRLFDEDGAESRKIIGRPVVSTLKMGCEESNFDERSSLLSGVLGMRILQ